MKKVTMITIMLSLILTACSGGTATFADGQSANQQADGQKQSINLKIHPELLIDRDALLEVAQRTNDYQTIEYTSEQLQQLKNDEQYKDYKNVIKKFVTDKLKTEVNTYQTIALDNHSRSILVTTKDEKAYKICLEMKDGIWLAECYAEIEWVTYPVK